MIRRCCTAPLPTSPGLRPRLCRELKQKPIRSGHDQEIALRKLRKPTTSSFVHQLEILIGNIPKALAIATFPKIATSGTKTIPLPNSSTIPTNSFRSVGKLREKGGSPAGTFPETQDTLDAVVRLGFFTYRKERKVECRARSTRRPTESFQ